MRLRNLNRPQTSPMTNCNLSGTRAQSRAFWCALLVTVMTLALAVPSLAFRRGGPTTHSNTSLQIRAGVVLIDSNNVNKSMIGNPVPLNDAPYVWYNLDHNLLVKPAGWSFYNPLAPSVVTQAIYNRWSALIGAANVPNVNTPLTKQNAAYWEVPLSSISDSAITNYDVLILPASQLISLSPSERGRLQKFMDQGGVLWVDVYGTTSIDAANGLPVAFTGANSGGNNSPSILNPVSQLASSPYTISYLPESTYSNDLIAVDLAGAGYGNYTALFSDVTPSFKRFEVVGEDGSGGRATVLYAKVGDGALVVTGRGSSAFLNQVTINGAVQPNTGFTGLPPTADNNSTMVARFAVNAINLVGGFSQANGGSRGTSSNPINIGAPLLQTWADETQTGGTQSAPPITYKGVVLVTMGNRLYAYSAKPGSDLYQDGNPDDGVQDYSLGLGRDLIWSSQALTPPLSAPVAMPVPGASNGNTDQVFVVDGNGKLQAFAVFPSLTGTLTNEPPINSYQAPGGSAAPFSGFSPAPFPPVVHDGFVYVTDTVDVGGSSVGRIWVADPLNQITNWAVGSNSGATLSATPFSAQVTVGYIPIFDNSGGVDKVLYAPTQPGNGNTCGIVSVWAGVKGEKHAVTDLFVSSGSQTMTIQTRATGLPIYLPSGADAHGFHIALLNSNGDPLSVSQMASLITGGTQAQPSPGTITLTVPGGLAGLQAAGVTAVAVDYSLDWNVNNTNQFLRGSLNLPDVSNVTPNVENQIVGNLALSPAGTLYVVEGSTSGTSHGAFYSIREQGRGVFNFVSRFDLFPAMTFALSTGTPQSLPATFEDNDGLQQIPAAAPYLGGPFTGLVYASGPSVQGSTVYVKARGFKKGTSGFQVPATLLLAFAAEPQLPQFTVPLLQAGYTILQPDPMRSLEPNAPDTYTNFAQTQITYTPGIGTANISFNNLAVGNRGAVNQIFSESLPIIIRQPGSPDIVLDPDTTGNWSPLQWYAVFDGLDCNGGTFGTNAATLPTIETTGNPVVTGQTLFFGANSLLPAVLTGTLGSSGFTGTGLLVGLTTNISSTDPFLVPNVSRPWFKQLQQIQIQSGGGFATNPDILWPQSIGVSDINTYIQRLLQTTLGGSQTSNPRTLYGLSAGDGGLFAYSNLGIYGFQHANFVVADQNRVAAFDPSGNALWTINATVSTGAASAASAGSVAASNTHPLVRPNHAYAVGNSSYLVTDPPANRVFQMDISGAELRTIENFQIDPNYVPAGFTAGETQSLSDPEDAFTYYDIQTASPFSNPAPTEYWKHYVIADTGNHRLIELVDRYNYDTNSQRPTTLIAAGVLFYHSPALYSGKGFDYSCVSRILIPTPTPHYIYVAATRSVTPGIVDLGVSPPATDPTTSGTPPVVRTAGDGDGGIIVIDGNNATAINTFTMPTVPAGVIFTPNLSNPSTFGFPGTFNAAPIAQHQVRIGNISSVTMSNYSPDGINTELRIMFTDGSGVYEIVPATAGPISSSTTWIADWALPANVYETMRWGGSGANTYALLSNPNGFHPGYARRTGANTVVVSNSYVGTYIGGTPFGGEVLELEGAISSGSGNAGFSFNSPFFGFSPLSIRFVLPTITGARGLIAPVYADRE